MQESSKTVLVSEALTLPQAAQFFGTREGILKSMVKAGIISPEREPSAVDSGTGRIRPSQFYRVEAALKIREEHPGYGWRDIAHAIPRMRPRNK